MLIFEAQHIAGEKKRQRDRTLRRDMLKNLRAGSAAGKEADKKEPAVQSAEKLMYSLTTGDTSQVIAALDPAIVFHCPMGSFMGRMYVKPWIEFEALLLQPYRQFLRHHSTTTDDGIKTGKTRWSVGGLHFTDYVTQTPLLTIKTIKRVVRRESKTQQDHDIAESLLLAWTGPYFSKYCGAKRKATLDNRAIILPVLDYSFMSLTNVRRLLSIEPKEGQAIADDSVVFHFLKEAIDAEKAMMEMGKAAEIIESGLGEKQNFGQTAAANQPSPKRRGTTITIQAKNRLGEVNAIILDKSQLDGKQETKIDQMEDAESTQLRRDRHRYLCSGLRLCNNSFETMQDLDQVMKIYLVNAFYFVTMVDLSSNKLRIIPDFSQLVSLQTLYLHDNHISEWGQLESLQSISQLQNLTLFGNPLQQKCESNKIYKFNVLYYFYSSEGFVSFATRQQTLQSTSDVPRPASRNGGEMQRTAAGSGAQFARAPTPALRTTLETALRSSSGMGFSNDKSLNGTSVALPVVVKISLKQLDHTVISPLEVETLEQFLPAIRRRLRALQNTNPAGGAAAASKQHGKLPALAKGPPAS